MAENKNFTEDELTKDIPEAAEENASKCGDEVDEDSCQLLNQKLADKEKECAEYLDLAKRTKAEFENFRRRTIKEKESLFDDGFSDAVKSLLPILDNLERAVEFNNLEKNSFSEGVEMVLKIFKDTLGKMGIEQIQDIGEKFNPEVHNAVMHIEDESLEENVVVEVLQKGYKYKNKVIRHSMVKVAN